MRYRNVLIVLFFMLLCLPACKSSKSQGTGPETIVVNVNGERITEDDLYLVMNSIHGLGQTSDMRSKTIEDIINQELLYQQGIKLGLDKDPKYESAVRMMEMRLRQFKRAEMARRVASTRIAATVDVNEDDVRKYFAENETTISTDFRFLLIRFPDGEKARAAYQKIKEGASFEAVAAGEYPNAQAGTVPRDSGFFHWNQIPLEWAKILAIMKKGEISGVLKSERSGIAIIKLVDTRKNTQATFEDMSASIMNRLRDVRIAEAYERYIQDMRKASRIVKHEERRDAS